MSFSPSLKNTHFSWGVSVTRSYLVIGISGVSTYIRRLDLTRDVRVLVASCLCQIIRVLAPDPPYNDKTLREIFTLLISMFMELSDTKSPYFTRRVKILETIARLKCCVIMMGLGCDDLVLEMFNIFFSVIREHHQQSLLHSMISIMSLILEEKVSWPLLDVILRNLLKEEKGAAPAHHRLAVSVLQDCTEIIEPFVRGFLTSAILDSDSVESELKEHYHEIILEIPQCAPQMLLSVIPSLSHELLTDQVDVRIKAVNLLGKLFALPGQHVVHQYRQLFIEFLKRFSDKSAEVRISALQCDKACYPAIPSGTETLKILASLEGRLLDFDDKVRIEAIMFAVVYRLPFWVYCLDCVDGGIRCVYDYVSDILLSSLIISPYRCSTMWVYLIIEWTLLSSSTHLPLYLSSFFFSVSRTRLFEASAWPFDLAYLGDERLCCMP
ncbi:hypothetical protein ACHQM5_005825 [Ranunculus cassubicifolius]